jgi:uncharacterized protein (DUF2235 family)
MKRLVICFDGTWNSVGNPDEVTNVVRVAQAVRSVASNGVAQLVYYNAGVGSGGPLDQFLGGVFGMGLRSNVKRALAFLALNWDPKEPGNEIADEIYIFGFSRGAYSARALAGVLRAIGGVPKQASFDRLEEIWDYYRKTEDERKPLKAEIEKLIYKVEEKDFPFIKCVAVWDTVGSYGIPSGLGLAALAKKITSWTRGFRDNRIGKHIEIGLHAMAIDERRRAFPTTAWVTNKDEDRKGVEQVWFVGTHSNIGGGYRRSGLSDQSLIWMIARVSELTQLEFDQDFIREHFWPCAACSLYRSDRGWLLSSMRPYLRPIPAALRAAAHAENTTEKGERLINAKVHWSVRDRVGRLALVDETRYAKYQPGNLPKDVEWAEMTEFEKELIALCRSNAGHKKRDGCALHRVLQESDRSRRTRRMRRLRKTWEDILPLRP